jgi:DNA-directed RNA polymerase specialized sigma24 family protein
VEFGHKNRIDLFRNYLGTMSKYRHDTSLGGVGRHFPVTEWTRILDTTTRKAMLDELCVKYWKPLYSYLRARGYANEQAKDLVQGFFTEKVIDQELVRLADRDRGKFRNLLLVALRNYTLNIHKKDKQVSSVSLDHPGIEPHYDQDAEKVFNRAWAETLLDRVLADLKRECDRKGRTIHWTLFHEWLIVPMLEQDKASMDDLCAKYDLANAAQAYKIIFRIKERFRTLLREKLRGLVGTNDDIDVEIGEFIAAFSK